VRPGRGIPADRSRAPSRGVSAPGEAQSPRGHARRQASAILALTAAFVLGIGGGENLRAEETRARDALAGLPAGAALVPPVFYPSDVVELRLPLPEGWDGKAPQPPASGDETSFLSVEAVRTGTKGSELRLKLVAWRPGAFTVPAFGSGSSRFGPFALRAESYIGATGAGFAPPRPPRLLRGTRAMIAAAFALFAVAALAAIGFHSFVLPWARRFGRRIREKRPYARFSHDVRIALKRRDDGDPRIFYDYLSAAFRRYALKRCGRGAASLTPAEAAGRAGAAAFGADAAEVSRILGRSDLVRFAALSSERGERAADADSLLRAVARMEERFDAL